MQTNQATLAALLGRAGSAHGVFEESELGGVYDEQWPAWYARYLVEHGIGDLLGRAIDAEVLSALLVRCDQDYKRDNPDEGWPTYYARRLLAPA